MRIVSFVVSLAAMAAMGLAATPSHAQDKGTRPASKGTAVPADVRAKVVAKLPGAHAEDVAFSPIPGIYEVTMGAVIVYVSEDGKYLLSGNVYDLDTQANLTASRRNAVRAKALASVREDQMIIFSPAKPKMTVTVFTDIDCGFCRKFHSQMAELNKAGIRVRYMAYPRTGPDTESWHKAEAVWCSSDRKDSLTRAKRGEVIKSKACGDAAIKAQYQLGDDLGVEGTPAIFTQSGDYVGGFLTPDQLLQTTQEAEKAAAVR